MIRTTLFPVVAPLEGAPETLLAVERVARQSAGARLALRHSARISGCQATEFEKGADDVPVPVDGWHWSITHTRALVGGVVARRPVGIDLQPVEVRREDLVERVLSPAEAALLGGRDARTFTRAWAAKEAVLKKTGAGLAGLGDCRVVLLRTPDLWLLEHRGRRHHASLADLGDHAAALSVDGAPTGFSWKVLRQLLEVTA